MTHELTGSCTPNQVQLSGIASGDQVPIQIQMGAITTTAQLTIAVRAP